MQANDQNQGIYLKRKSGRLLIKNICNEKYILLVGIMSRTFLFSEIHIPKYDTAVRIVRTRKCFILACETI